VSSEEPRPDVTVAPALLNDLRQLLEGRPTGGGMRAYIREHTLVVMTLLGLLFYGGGLLVYSRFYGAFGVAPDEVGLTYTAALTHLVPAFFLWVFAWLGAILSLLLVYGALSVVWSIALGVRRRGRAHPEPDRERSRDRPSGDTHTGSGAVGALWRKFRKHPVEGSAVVIAALIALFLVSALYKPGDLAERVSRGGEVRPILDTNRLGFTFDAIWRNPLRIRVEHVRVWPTNPGDRLPANLTTGTILAYLGGTADTVVLYDARRRRTLRIPTRLIVLSDPGRLEGGRRAHPFTGGRAR
jgi:hypothetical protein